MPGLGEGTLVPHPTHNTAGNPRVTANQLRPAQTGRAASSTSRQLQRALSGPQAPGPKRGTEPSVPRSREVETNPNRATVRAVGSLGLVTGEGCGCPRTSPADV
jgi:hypothetical protein